MAGRKQPRLQCEGDVIGMSEEALSNTSIKNELEKWKLMNEMHSLTCDEKLNSMNNRRNLRKLKDDVTKMLAEGCVYKLHGFQRYDPFLSGSESDTDEKAEEKRSLKSNLNKIKTTNSSGTLPEIVETGFYVKSNLNTYEKKNENAVTLFGKKVPTLDASDNSSSFFDENDNESDDNNSLSTSLSPLAKSFHGMVLWRQKIRDRIIEKEKTKVEPPVRYHPKVEIQNVTNRYKQMFPGNCRTYFAMKKFVEKEADTMINKVDSPLYSKKMSHLEKLKKKCQIPEIIRRDRSTSAIFRDFKNYKTKKTLIKNQRVTEWQTSS
uniref:Uncharacterized protein LOC111109519 n=1 Tax=Crassostrea virginica TaxID=6565 RepID=A0A8B8BEE1_CRAVI|nr:uncharacterized protein LOC111109519 [Crassostrea virginica]